MGSPPLLSTDNSNLNHKLRKNKEIDNPCLKEYDLSMRCLSENNQDKNLCEVTFSNYIQCKGFWDKVRFERRKAGLNPQLPPPEERAAAKEFYMNKFFNKK